MTELAEGMKAPEFSLPRDGGETVALSDYSGRKLVLFFYPKDDTSGCTAEAIAFTALEDKFKAAGTAILGMSPDSVKKHDKFIAKHELSVPLASDEEKTTLQTYGVWVEKSMYGRKYMGVERSTFLIDENGNIEKIWRKVKVPGHAEAVLEAVGG
ncbi:thioredoxin-dependent thiol peroxidase [Hoeflea prorocentri]|uniref:thioredoxin-dependent peroxiredoxin n=1 Tax=Hoeflea prorocentri TaxID=1922333 RepID=A0A9X3ZHC3_9HYPH|nr:thioredoxin-dependent thiol peroxidase [Hoeflea prorocentri]MCY6380625.1 thioredoxin-dependent thiol peroxidase [Hoeflea prorocentri]MDA5398425.1 thioredoxin-dependent thiol peroxidase [Hoeflea prorocentri]